MEEQVGELWHRLVTRVADTHYRDAAVGLADVERSVAVLFRALGGDGGLQVTSAEATDQRARRNWLQRLAGTNVKVTLAWRDDTFLRLPPELDWFPEKLLNRDLYFWLAALAVGEEGGNGDWFEKNQRLVRSVLKRFPGMNKRYRRLVQAHLALRPDPAKLPGREADAERAIRHALENPGSVERLPAGRRPPAPIPLWLHPDPPISEAESAEDPSDDADRQSGDQRQVDRLRRQARRVNSPDEDRGLVTIRMENIFSWGEFVKVDRGSEDEDDLGRAEAVARDIDHLSVSRDAKSSAATLRFDLDLPSEAHDDDIVSEGRRLPEWDWKTQRLVPDHCRVLPLLARDADPCAVPAHLTASARRLRRQFQALAPARVWHRAQPDGQEVDLDAYLRFAADRAAGHGRGGEDLYRDMRSGARDLACLLMADLSLSTDTWVNDHHRVIDVIRDSLFLFAEALAGTGDQFAIYGFSSRKRDPIRVHQVKGFDENYDGRIRGRIQAITPGYYTRMGAALRYASEILSEQQAGKRLLLLLTDGKPNDLDKYEGRYGIEDTRHAVLEARRQGLMPFCVTIDEEANDYLPHIFGSSGYVLVRRPSDLPKCLPKLYAQLTA